MTLQEMFQSVGGEYEPTLHRFTGNSGLLGRFIRKFPQDLTYQELCDAMAVSDHDRILRAAHTLKGLAGNLGFSTLSQHCDMLVVAIRQQRFEDLRSLFDVVASSYEEVISGIQELDRQ